MAHNAYIFRYRVRNWRTYNQALIDRGGLTFWIDEDALATWRNTQSPIGSGAPRIYSDTAIQCAVVVKSVYCLSLRAAQGFVSSVMNLMRLDLPVPNTVSEDVCVVRQVSNRGGFSLDPQHLLLFGTDHHAFVLREYRRDLWGLCQVHECWRPHHQPPVRANSHGHNHRQESNPSQQAQAFLVQNE